jgi:capsular polysaccharide biosynthesis protein
VLKPWHLTGEQIYDACSGRVPVQSPGRKTVSYDGRFRELLPRRLLDVEGEIRTPERVIAEYTDASVLGHEMVVRAGRRYIVPVEVGSERRYSPRLAETIPVSDALRQYVSRGKAGCQLDRAFLLTGKRGLPFAHWFYETLPKLRWYERYCRIIDQRPPLLIPSRLTDWQLTALDLMGYPEGSWTEQDSAPTRVGTLAIPPHPYRNRGSRFTGDPSNIRWIRSRILSNVTESDRSLPTRIYVSRSDAGRRRVHNEEELMQTLEDIGFEGFCLSHLPFEEQVRLFADADIVVGPHGAGLTNIIYGTDVDVVELMTRQGAAEHFFVLANELGHSYEFVLCDPIEDDGIPPRHRDMVADPNRVRKAITDL